MPGSIGFVLAAVTQAGDRMIQIAVFGASASYVLMTLSHIVLRRREPDLERPYRTPGGVVTTGVALVLACAAFVAVFLVDVTAALITLGLFVLALALLLVLQPAPAGGRRTRGGVRRHYVRRVRAVLITDR